MNKLIEQILRSAAKAGEGHIPSALSVLDLLWVLYDKVLVYRADDPKWEQRDRFILSKGHGSIGLYAILANKGFFDCSELDRFAQFGSSLGGHPDSNKVLGVEASTGSLGHGFPIAVGIALGLKIKQGAQRVFVLVGDGECNEGTVWESALLASHHKLSNLCCIVDFNNSTDRALSLGNIRRKFEAFDWACCEVDGHDQANLQGALSCFAPTRPTAAIARTVKGKGCPTMENNPAWHHRSPSREELIGLLQELT